MSFNHAIRSEFRETITLGYLRRVAHNLKFKF